MTDDIMLSNEDFVRSDVLSSMKNQMTPSEDVVSDLLAKITECAVSPEALDNTISFDQTRFAQEETVKKAKKHTTKSIWLYSTAAVAGVIVLLSTFSIFGVSDNSKPADLLEDVLGNQTAVVTPNDAVEKTTDKDAVVKEAKDEDEKGGFLSNLFKKEDTKNNDATDNNSASSVKDEKDSKDITNHSAKDNASETGDNSPTDVEPSSDEKNTSGGGNETYVDDSKITPGQPGSSDISFNREILADASVSNITISGSNYVVESASNVTETSSELKSISLDIPETSTTNGTTVRAKVKKVASVSSKLMIAVDVDGFKQTLVYANADYVPDNLDAFISDAGLNSASFSKSVYCKGENIGYSSYHRFSVSNINELVNQYVLSQKGSDLSNYNSYISGMTHVLFKSTSNPTNSTIDFGVSDNGYLYVKMASGKSFTFHIGKKNASAFINSVAGK